MVETSLDNQKNIFEKIRDNEAQSKIVYQDTWVTGFLDIKPDAPIHILLIPNKKFNSLQDISEDDSIYMIKILMAAKNLAQKHQIHDSGYRLITNCGENGGQEIDYLHFHLVGGVKLGKMINLPKKSRKEFKRMSVKKYGYTTEV
mgnify:CR=1 FL=1|tara:strand:- start:174 stop:608 length:435 start_codon:yes stop_codon:yes gene_type:complete